MATRSYSIHFVSPDGQEFRWDGFCDCQECSQHVADDGTVGVEHDNRFSNPGSAWVFAEHHHNVNLESSIAERRAQGYAVH